ncbi:MAG: excinuclease ABC subunit UvrC [Candidatus Heimdallarchaeota archaeon]|nr:excinuclease ABC subunit UvrC [Candidatus Heimdallarchaeota archaeon]
MSTFVYSYWYTSSIMDVRLKRIHEKLQTIPKEPGVYVIYDEHNCVIYVGKAKNLVNRLRNHFSASNDFSKSRVIREKGADFKVHVVKSENEALLLEYSFIQEYQPDLNEHWKDNKTYPYLEVTTGEQFPRLVVTRDRENEESVYLGPFSSVNSLRKSLKYVLQLFPVADCDKEIHFGDASGWAHTCIRRRTRQCMRPCELEVNEQEYRDNVNQVVNFIEGRIPDIADSLQTKMKEASKEMRYEEAAKYRDLYRAVNRTLERQQVMIEGVEDCYVLSHSSNKLDTCICLSKVIDGRISRQETKIIQNDEIALSDNKYLFTEYVINFIITILQLHDGKKPEILKFILDTKQPKTLMKNLNDLGFVSKEAEGEIELQLIVLNKHHAKRTLQQKLLLSRDSETPTSRVEDLQNLLHMEFPPLIIDCFDVSTLLGSNNVASCIRFSNGIPFKSGYRRFKIKTVEQQDDFASMQEAVYRRYRTVKEGKDSKGLPIPDLIVIDGGKEQLKRSRISLEKLNLDIPIIGLAKKEEEIYIPTKIEPLQFGKNRPGILLIRSARDEAHRFAVSYQRKLRQKEGLASLLDLIEGIGNKRKKAILTKYKTVVNIAKESSETLSESIGISKKLASEVIDTCRKFVDQVDKRENRRRRRRN